MTGQEGRTPPVLTVVDSRKALLAVLSHVVRVARENGAEYAQYGDLFHQGIVMGYVDVLSNVQVAAERYGVSPEQIGLADLDLEKELIEPVKRAAARLNGDEE